MVWTSILQIWELTVIFLGKLLSTFWRKGFSGLGVHAPVDNSSKVSH